MVENGVIRVVDTPSPGPAPPRRFSVRCCLGIFVLVWLGESVCVCVYFGDVCESMVGKGGESLGKGMCVAAREKEDICERFAQGRQRAYISRV